MRYARIWTTALGALFGLTAACGSEETTEPVTTLPPTTGGTGGAGGAGGSAAMGGMGGTGGHVPEPICLAPGEGPYGLTFTDVTAAVGLGPEALRMTGANVTVADIDGDHWPDLMLTRPANATVSPNLRENPAAPLGIYHLYRNALGASFEEVTWSSGLFRARDGTDGRATTFVLWGDVDNDGDVDALSAVYQDADTEAELLDATAIYLNDGTGTFTIGPDQRFTPQLRDPISGAAFLDYDRNGVLDLWVGHHYGNYGWVTSSVADVLLAGDATGWFNDVTVAAGLEQLDYSQETAAAGTNRKPTWGVSACDVDGDGWTDLMSASYGRQYNALYRSLGDGTFEDLTLTSGFASDELEDYSDNQFYRCYCEEHPDDLTCEGAGPPSISCSQYSWVPGTDDQPWRLGGNSSNTVCGDVDNDGDQDLLAVELAHWHIGASSDKTELLLNDGFPGTPLRRPGAASTGIDRPRSGGWNDGDLGGAMADFDNDGRLDAVIASSDYPGTTSLLYQQQADGRFVEVAEASGALRRRAHGIGVLDFDRDGDLDLVLGTSLARWSASDPDGPPLDDYHAVLLRNDTGQGANKLILHLVGSGQPGGANRDAVGARVTVQAGGQTLMREVQGGYGLTGFQQDRLVVIGLGAACSADQVTVRWPNATATEESFAGLLANYVVLLEEGAPPVYQPLAEYAVR
jgi:hypothetical protein